jgi:hypothetical protein
MRIIYSALLLLFAGASFAQDPEFPDFRSKKEQFTKVNVPDMRGDLASFVFAGIDESAGKPTLPTLPLKAIGQDFMSFEGNNIQVTINLGVFDASKHKLQYYNNTENNRKYLVRINAKPFFGDYGKLPHTTIKNISVVIDGDSVAIPPEAYFDIYNPMLTYTENGVKKHMNTVYRSLDGKRIYIYMLKRESGGSYEVTWVIENKKYVRRIVDFGFLK